MNTFREFYDTQAKNNLLPDALSRATGLAKELEDTLKEIDDLELPDRLSHFVARIAQETVAIRHNINALVHRIEDEGNVPLDLLRHNDTSI